MRDLAIALHKQGVHVEVYSPELGAVADEIRDAGIHVVDSTQELIMKPDLIHAQHFVPAMDAMVRFPDVPAVYFLHDRTHPADNPPKYHQIVRYVAVDYNCIDRLVIDNGIDEKLTDVLFNWVDTNRFALRENISEKPSRALLFSNYANKDNYFQVIRDACSRLDIELDVIGKRFGNPVKDPEVVLHHYDLVFAKAKAAMEALATGAGVILCDTRGLGEFVNRENFNHFRKFNFGMKTLTRPIEVDPVIGEIRKYNHFEILNAAHLIRKEASFDVYLDNIRKLYDTSIKEYRRRHKEIKNDDEIITIRKYLSLKDASFREARIKFKQDLSTSLEKQPGSILERENMVKEWKEKIRSLSQENIQLKRSLSYRIGRFLTAPARFIYKFF